MRKCPKCKSEVPEDKQFCQECLYNVGFWEEFGIDYEEKSIDPRFNSMDPKRFMYNDRLWEKDIKSRRTLPDGSIGKFRNGRRYA
jgi:RNA polymerase subunit RPABC4/transcription elongation factor Spt4